MKNILLKISLLFVIVFVFSCQRNIIPKPEKFIPEKKMEQILYDLSLLNAAKNLNNDQLIRHDITVEKFIYERHNIDSLQFAENMVYYSSHPKKLKEMMDTVEKRLKVKYDSITGSKENEPLKSEEVPPAKIVLDSLENSITK